MFSFEYLFIYFTSLLSIPVAALSLSFIFMCIIYCVWFRIFVSFLICHFPWYLVFIIMHFQRSNYTILLCACAQFTYMNSSFFRRFLFILFFLLVHFKLICSFSSFNGQFCGPTWYGLVDFVRKNHGLITSLAVKNAMWRWKKQQQMFCLHLLVFAIFPLVFSLINFFYFPFY